MNWAASRLANKKEFQRAKEKERFFFLVLERKMPLFSFIFHTLVSKYSEHSSMQDCPLNRSGVGFPNIDLK